MKAAVLYNSKFVIKDIPKPLLSDYENGAIIKVIGCGLCGSDIVKIRTGKAGDGSVLGHEVIGEIVEIKSNTAFEVGDKVVLGHHVPCFNCVYCWGENYSMCRHFKKTNIVPGGFAEYIFVSEEHLQNTVFKVNLCLSDAEASFLEPLGCCVRAVKRAGIDNHTNNLIIGLGSIGILMGQTVTAFGNKAYGCDLLYERVSLSEDYGLEKSFQIKDEEETLKEMKTYVPYGFDNVFLTAGASKSLDFAVKAVRDGGKIIVFSSIKDNLAGFKNNDIYYRELTVMGSYSPAPMDLEDSMELLESGKVCVEGISQVYPIEKLNDAINDTLSNKIMKAFIKI